MTVNQLTAVLEKIIKLHDLLYQLAEKKTDIIKQGDIDALSQLMKEEQKYMLAIRQLEGERINLSKEILRGYNQDETLAAVITVVDEPFKTTLTHLREQLIDVVVKLKDQNELNQQLTQQSLHFVNMSLDMIQPRPQVVNYENPSKSKQESSTSSRSMFDSKA
ncbi:flagellar protein FlgN [Bacillus timonensis]|nr:flagellar protein FlgN [Bacillus timonensis]